MASEELYYIDKQGVQQDAALHEGILGDNRESLLTRRARAQKLGLTRRQARALYPK